MSLSLVEHWGTTDALATGSFHPSLFSAFLKVLFCHLFLCLPLFLPPGTVPRRTVFASPDNLIEWPYHLSFRFFTSQEVIIWPNGLPNSVTNFFIRDVISVGDAKEFSEASHLLDLNGPFQFSC